MSGRGHVVFMITRESTRLASERRQFRDSVRATQEIRDVKMCILTCPFEPPKPKTKHKLDISSKEDYDKLFQREQAYFGDMVEQC